MEILNIISDRRYFYLTNNTLYRELQGNELEKVFFEFMEEVREETGQLDEVFQNTTYENLKKIVDKRDLATLNYLLSVVSQHVYNANGRKVPLNFKLYKRLMRLRRVLYSPPIILENITSTSLDTIRERFNQKFEATFNLLGKIKTDYLAEFQTQKELNIRYQSAKRKFLKQKSQAEVRKMDNIRRFKKFKKKMSPSVHLVQGTPETEITWQVFYAMYKRLANGVQIEDQPTRTIKDVKNFLLENEEKEKLLQYFSNKYEFKMKKSQQSFFTTLIKRELAAH